MDPKALLLIGGFPAKTKEPANREASRRPPGKRQLFGRESSKIFLGVGHGGWLKLLQSNLGR